ncbi:MAG: endonuclease/exonuclease/phosphatase family protein [Gammaproteobacteria bacterium]|nr:endonuclease/exonuclease/phosphatase family protein [Gammaproteobacteria bacterium]
MRMIALLGCLALTMTACGAEEESMGDEPVRLRVATFNIAMGLEEHGDLARALESGSDGRLHRVAEILRRVRPDVLLLNEFDYDAGVDAARLFNERYLAMADDGGAPALRYDWHFRAPVNTGVDSGLDLDGDGETGGPGDAWGFGRFPGQYGMLVLSRFPIDRDRSRTFQSYRWADLPGAARPVRPDGSPFYDEATWAKLRLSSKSHWDLLIDVDGRELHFLAHHPTPPVFDGPEDRNGRRNFDEIRFWREYTDPDGDGGMNDDQGRRGGIEPGARFVMAGDFNADPLDGDSRPGAIAQVLDVPWVRGGCVPTSRGAAEAAVRQAGVNGRQRGDAAADTADFNDERTGNLRLDYVLPSQGLKVVDCGVFWPAADEPGHELLDASDHRLVWLDIER